MWTQRNNCNEGKWDFIWERKEIKMLKELQMLKTKEGQ